MKILDLIRDDIPTGSDYKPHLDAMKMVYAKVQLALDIVNNKKKKDE